MIFFFGSAWFTWYSVNHKITHATRPTLYVPWVQRMRFSVMLRFIFKYCVDCFCGEQKEFCVRFKQTTKMQIILQTKQIVIWWNILSVDHLPFSHLLHTARWQDDATKTGKQRQKCYFNVGFSLISCYLIQSKHQIESQWDTCSRSIRIFSFTSNCARARNKYVDLGRGKKAQLIRQWSICWAKLKPLELFKRSRCM